MDYDVAAKSLASPPASAPVQSYRPAVAVENLGIHSASVTGTLRIYDRDAGTLITTMALAASDIEPGETRNATADQLWEPVAGDIGKAFLFTATIVYPPDQDLSNNNLGPTTVIVTAAPPPPPPPVEAHASQHEDGGGDEIDVDGLTGKLAEAQTPTEHASNHEAGGDDQLSVTGLLGELATPQTPKTHASTHGTGGSDPVTGLPVTAHHTSHEPGGSDALSGIPAAAHKTSHQNGGTDELSVAGLSGELADPQTPKAHQSSHISTAADEIPLMSAMLLTDIKDNAAVVATGGGGVVIDAINPCTVSTPAYASMVVGWQGQAYCGADGMSDLIIAVRLDGSAGTIIGITKLRLYKEPTTGIDELTPFCILASHSPVTSGAHSLYLVAYNTGTADAYVQFGSAFVIGVQ